MFGQGPPGLGQKLIVGLGRIAEQRGWRNGSVGLVIGSSNARNGLRCRGIIGGCEGPEFLIARIEFLKPGHQRIISCGEKFTCEARVHLAYKSTSPSGLVLS